MNVNPSSLSTSIKKQARRLGFELCRILPLCEASQADFYEAWLALGRAGEMGYLERNVEKRRFPKRLADDDSKDFQSIIVLGVNHYQFPLPPELANDPSRGIIASYAWGDDYHEIIRPALYELDSFIAQQTGRETGGKNRGKCLVDTGPVLERDWAQQAGLGFTGKNCCTIHPRLGSWLLLATILVPEQLTPDLLPPPVQIPNASPMGVIEGLPSDREYGRWRIPLDDNWASHDKSGHTGNNGQNPVVGTCGQCTRCLDDCPTNAFVGPYHLDPVRCISYWTIESREPIPYPLRVAFGNRIFGCDICQEVCPWNQRMYQRMSRWQPRSVPAMTGLAAQEGRISPPLLEGFQPESPYWLKQDAFSQRFRRSPIKRAKRTGMLRNVCVALGNWADPVVVEPLLQALSDEDPLPRGHAAWALGEVQKRHPIDSVERGLQDALMQESVAWVQEEIRLALRGSY